MSDHARRDASRAGLPAAPQEAVPSPQIRVPRECIADDDGAYGRGLCCSSNSFGKPLGFRLLVGFDRRFLPSSAAERRAQLE